MALMWHGHDMSILQSGITLLTTLYRSVGTIQPVPQETGSLLTTEWHFQPGIKIMMPMEEEIVQLRAELPGGSNSATTPTHSASMAMRRPTQATHGSHGKEHSRHLKKSHSKYANPPVHQASAPPAKNARRLITCVLMRSQGGELVVRVL